MFLIRILCICSCILREAEYSFFFSIIVEFSWWSNTLHYYCSCVHFDVHNQMMSTYTVRKTISCLNTVCVLTTSRVERIGVFYWKLLDPTTPSNLYVDFTEPQHVYGTPQLEYPGMIKVNQNGRGIRHTYIIARQTQYIWIYRNLNSSQRLTKCKHLSPTVFPFLLLSCNVGSLISIHFL